MVCTRVQTPRRWGAPFRAGVFVLSVLDSRPSRTSCWMVGTPHLSDGVTGDGTRTDRPRGRPTMVRPGGGGGNQVGNAGPPGSVVVGMFSKHKTEMVDERLALPGRDQPMPVHAAHDVNGNRIVPPFPEGLRTAV